MHFLDADEAVFYREGEILFLQDDPPRRVCCRLLFPLTRWGEFVSVREERAGKREEVGIVARLDDLSGPSRQAVEEELRFRYFTPEITRIHRVSVRGRTARLRVTTDRGDAQVTLVELREQIVTGSHGEIFLRDAAQRRYRIGNIGALPPADQRKIDRLFF